MASPAEFFRLLFEDSGGYAFMWPMTVEAVINCGMDSLGGVASCREGLVAIQAKGSIGRPQELGMIAAMDRMACRTIPKERRFMRSQSGTGHHWFVTFFAQFFLRFGQQLVVP